MDVIVLASQKGGAGKTTLAAHLAIAAEATNAGPARDHPRPASDIPVEIQIRLVHESLDRQYRALLYQPSRRLAM